MHKFKSEYKKEKNMNYNEELETENNSDIDIRNESKSRNRINEKISKSLKKNIAKQSLVKALFPIVMYIATFLIVLIIIIGIAIFFITLPGMVMDKLKTLSIKMGSMFSRFFGGDSTVQIEEEQIYEVLDYLEEMGYDLKGYGFLTDYVGESQDGVERDDDGNIKKAESDFIFSYLTSDNYVYTIANYNQINGLANNGHRILGGLVSIFQKIGNILKEGQLGKYWGRGMISIYHEASVGVPGAYFGGIEEWLNWSDIKININEESDKKELEIRRGWGSDTKTFNLDGWTGRYGMPLDFLISVHLATFMPDLAYDMVESFDTQVVILLHNTGNIIEGNATYDPYIAYVKNHWYRDIYFVQTNKEFIDYDYEYEALMKERWTLYETYEDENASNYGEYKLYEIDEKGEYKKENGEYVLYEGTLEQAQKDNVSVAKKAKTLKYSDEEDFKEISWSKNSFGIWSAYELQNGNIVQTGDGLRTETNSTIKKCF